jgi:hypothetical protein
MADSGPSMMVDITAASGSSSAATRANAKHVAKALAEELEWPTPMEQHIKDQMVSDFYDKEPPDRSDLGFQTKKNANPRLTSTPKAVDFEKMGDCSNDMFCPAHGEFARLSGTDIEHAMPFEKIKERQKAFLKFLNKDKAFADSFVKELGVGDFFKKSCTVLLFEEEKSDGEESKSEKKKPGKKKSEGEESGKSKAPKVPEKLEAQHAPGIVLKSDGTFALIVNGKDGVEKIDAPAELTKRLSSFYEKNRKEAKAILAVDDDIMRGIVSQGHLLKDEDVSIKGTRYFYKICYNNYNNLWSVCHACNIEKSNKESLVWFKAQEHFGQKFVDEVNTAGLFTGVIFDRVGGTSIGVLPIGKDRADCQISTGGTGMGEYAKTWFLKHHQPRIEAHRSFRQVVFAAFRNRLDGMLEPVSGNASRRRSELKSREEAAKIYTALISVRTKDYTHDSKSSEDSERRDDRTVQLVTAARASTYVSHYVRDLESFLKKKYSGDTRDIESFFKDLLAKLCEPKAGVSEDDAKKLRNNFKDSTLLSWQDLKQEISVMAESLGTLGQTRQEGLAEKERAEAAEGREEKERERAEAEKAEKEEMQRRVQELEEKLKQLEATGSSRDLSEQLGSLNSQTLSLKVSGGGVDSSPGDSHGFMLHQASSSSLNSNPLGTTGMDIDTLDGSLPGLPDGSDPSKKRRKSSSGSS